MRWQAFGLIAFTMVAVTNQRVVKRQAEEDEKRVVCYYTDWSVYRTDAEAKFTPNNINPYICTHILYSFIKLDIDNNSLLPFDEYQDITMGGFKQVTDLKNLNEDLKIMGSVGGWNEGSSRFSQLAADPERRAQFVVNAIPFLRKYNFDGLDIAWQYPAFRDGSSPNDKANYALLIKELREGFEKEAEETGNERLTLSVVMSALSDYIERGYDVPALNEYLDFINLVAYDYFLASSPVVHHHSPLFPLKEDLDDPVISQLTVDASIQNLFNRGASPDKVNLGIPSYGRIYMLEEPEENKPGSFAKGNAAGNTTVEPGYITYYELCKSIKDGGWTVEHPNKTAMGPYAFKNELWVGFDDPESAKHKGEYARKMGLGGVMVWTIDDDDFRGTCHGRGNPIIRAAREGIMSRDEVKKPPAVISHAPTNAAPTPSPPEVVVPPIPLTRGNPPPPRIPYIPPSHDSDDSVSILPQKDSKVSLLLPNNVFFQDINVWIENHFHGFPKQFENSGKGTTKS